MHLKCNIKHFNCKWQLVVFKVKLTNPGIHIQSLDPHLPGREFWLLKKPKTSKFYYNIIKLKHEWAGTKSDTPWMLIGEEWKSIFVLNKIEGSLTRTTAFIFYSRYIFPRASVTKTVRPDLSRLMEHPIYYWPCNYHITFTVF